MCASSLRKGAGLLTVLGMWQFLASAGANQPIPVPSHGALYIAGAFTAYLLLPPTRLVVAAYELVADGSLSQHVVASLERVLVGFLLAALAGIPLGVLLGWSRFVSDLLGPIVEGLRPIPPTRAEARRRTRWLPDDILSAEQPNAQEAPPS